MKAQTAGAEASLEAIVHELAKYDDHDLETVISAAGELLKERREERRRNFVVEVLEQAMRLGLDRTSVVEAFFEMETQARTSIPAKYREIGGDRTWTGRGKTPRWVLSLAEATGQTLEQWKNDPRNLIEK